MCVAIYKPKGVEFPSWKRLKECWDVNPDGAGFMFADGNDVNIYKGFMTWKDFKKALKPYKSSEVAREQAFAIHFRIATQGGVNAEMCHPFPLSSSVAELKKTHTRARIGVVHNGIIPLTSSVKKSSLSDTALFIKDYMTLLIKSPYYYQASEKAKILTMIEELIQSKMCVLSADGHSELIGYGWEAVDGVWYSNLYWKRDTLTLTDWGTIWKPAKTGKAAKCEFEKTGDWVECYYCGNTTCENYSGGYYE